MDEFRNHLSAHKGQDQCDGGFDVLEGIDGGGHQGVEGTEGHDGEDVGGVDDERVLGREGEREGWMVRISVRALSKKNEGKQ